MPEAYRLAKRKYAPDVWSAMNGRGAWESGGRYNSAGTTLVYASATLSLATLEIVVNTDREFVLPAFVLCRLEFEESLVKTLDPGLLPESWRDSPPPFSVQSIGDTWVREARSAILRVPSAIIPQESSYLVNPAHEDYPRLYVSEPEPYEFDPRLFK